MPCDESHGCFFPFNFKSFTKEITSEENHFGIRRALVARPRQPGDVIAANGSGTELRLGLPAVEWLSGSVPEITASGVCEAKPGFASHILMSF